MSNQTLLLPFECRMCNKMCEPNQRNKAGRMCSECTLKYSTIKSYNNRINGIYNKLKKHLKPEALEIYKQLEQHLIFKELPDLNASSPGNKDKFEVFLEFLKSKGEIDKFNALNFLGINIKQYHKSMSCLSYVPSITTVYNWKDKLINYYNSLSVNI